MLSRKRRVRTPNSKKLETFSKPEYKILHTIRHRREQKLQLKEVTCFLLLWLFNTKRTTQWNNLLIRLKTSFHESWTLMDKSWKRQERGHRSCNAEPVKTLVMYPKIVIWWKKQCKKGWNIATIVVIKTSTLHNTAK